MQESWVRARVKVLAQTDTDPLALSEGELQLILDDARRPDLAGVLPGAATWAGLWDVDAAICAAWELKAAKAAALYDFGAAGENYSRSHLIRHCQDMLSRYQRKRMGTMLTAGRDYTVTTGITSGGWPYPGDGTVDDLEVV